MNQFYQFGPAVMALRDFWNRTPWDLWTWKLDPYRIPSQAEEKADFRISGGEAPGNPQASELLYSEPDGFYIRQVLAAAEGGRILQLIEKRDGTPLLQYHISDDYRDIRVLCDGTGSGGQAAFELLGRTAAYAMLNRSVLTFHGVLMEQKGRGVILAAPSGTGKTTHARLWREKKRALILNGDNACCYVKNGRWTGFGIPWSGTSGEAVNREAPVQALVLLEQSEENHTERLTGLEAFGELLPVLQCPTWDAEYSERALELLEAFLQEIPVLRLYCRPEEEAVEVLSGALEELEQEWKKSGEK